MRDNSWKKSLMSIAQSAIDDELILLDEKGREPLFEAVRESLRAKENTHEVAIKDQSDHNGWKTILVPLSGGLDSLVAYEKAREETDDVRAFYVYLNTPYSYAELDALEEIKIPFEIIDLHNWPKNWRPYETKWQHILPLRNLLIIMSIAEIVGDHKSEIWLGATEGEIPATGGDKSLKFFYAADKMLSTLPVHHELKFPLSSVTKTELVQWWRGSGRDVNVLLKTITCQSPMERVACGACHACFNRWIALSNNGLSEELAQDPRTIEANGAKIGQFRSALKDHDFDTWSERRIVQSLKAWDESPYPFPPSVLDKLREAGLA